MPRENILGIKKAIHCKKRYFWKNIWKTIGIIVAREGRELSSRWLVAILTGSRNWHAFPDNSFRFVEGMHEIDICITHPWTPSSWFFILTFFKRAAIDKRHWSSIIFTLDLLYSPPAFSYVLHLTEKCFPLADKHLPIFWHLFSCLLFKPGKMQLRLMVAPWHSCTQTNILRTASALTS